MLNDTRLGRKKDSLWWRDIVIVGDDVLSKGLFNACVRRVLGNGEGVNFWNHHWLGQQPLYDVFPNLLAGCTDRNFSVAAAGRWFSDRWQWQFPEGSFSDQIVSEEASSLSAIL